MKYRRCYVVHLFHDFLLADLPFSRLYLFNDYFQPHVSDTVEKGINVNDELENIRGNVYCCCSICVRN